jgi:hypothetical protein
MKRVSSAFSGRRIALALLGLGALASATLATGRLAVVPPYAPVLLLLFVIALWMCARGSRCGHVIGSIAVSALSALLMLAAVGLADPDTHQSTDFFPSDALYLVVVLAAAYWIATVAALRHIASNTPPGTRPCMTPPSPC